PHRTRNHGVRSEQITPALKCHKGDKPIWSVYMHSSLKDKTTLVTGVTSGIGREIAQLLAERGARVFGTVRNPQSASPSPGVEIVRMDVTDDSSVNEAVQSIEQKAGPVQL